jgi:hypothetical protein
MVADDEKVDKPDRPVPLKTLRDGHGAYAGRLVNLERLYFLGNTVERRPDGVLVVDLLEIDLGAKDQGRSGTLEVPIDRRLAGVIKEAGKIPRQADRLPDQQTWDKEPALVTIKVHDGGEAVPYRIVRLEFLKNCNATVNGTKYDFDVDILRATESGAESVQGNPFEWRRIGRLHRIYNEVVARAKATKALKNQMLAQQMSMMAGRALQAGIQQGLSNAAAVGQMRRNAIGR